MDGDPGYAGLMTKNPVHEDWEVMQFADDPYSLDDLFGHLDDLGFMPPQNWRKRAKRDVSGLGRNCQLFELLRGEAYPAINRYWGDADGYAKHVETLAIQINADSFATPLPYSEVKACEIAGVEPEFSNDYVMEPDEIGPWVISHNLHRRHLTVSQKAAVAVAYEEELSKLTKANSLKNLKQNLPKDPDVVNLQHRESQGRASEQAARDAYRASGGAMTNKQIADGVGMSIKWVEKHRAAIKG